MPPKKQTVKKNKDGQQIEQYQIIKTMNIDKNVFVIVKQNNQYYYISDDKRVLLDKEKEYQLIRDKDDVLQCRINIKKCIKNLEDQKKQDITYQDIMHKMYKQKKVEKNIYQAGKKFYVKIQKQNEKIIKQFSTMEEAREFLDKYRQYGCKKKDEEYESEENNDTQSTSSESQEEFEIELDDEQVKNLVVEENEESDDEEEQKIDERKQKKVFTTKQLDQFKDEFFDQLKQCHNGKLSVQQKINETSGSVFDFSDVKKNKDLEPDREKDLLISSQ